MIQMTVDRLTKLIPLERIFVVTGKGYVDLLREQLPSLPLRNIIVEPVGRNTAPCIGLSAFMVNKYYENSSMIVLSSDHLIVNEEEFLKTIKSVDEFIHKHEDAIVTFGMKPNRPETGYSYIKCGSNDENINDYKIAKVEKFIEKPNVEKAKEYLREGNFLWNGGMFIWKCKNVLKLIKMYLAKTYEVLSEMAACKENGFEEVLEKKYPEVESIFVDDAIMEKAENIYVIHCDFGWDDIGTWYSVERYRTKDEDNNVFVGDIKNIDDKNNIVVGISDLFVVENDDIIFVGKKEDIERIKEIKKKL